MGDPVRVGSIGDWSHVELARVIRREIDRNTKKKAGDPNVSLSALIDITLQYDSDNNGSGSFIVKKGTTPYLTLDNNGNLTLDRGSDATLYVGTGGSDLHRYLEVLNSVASANAAGVKMGGLLVADNYGLASPTAGNATIQKGIVVGVDGTASGSISLHGTATGLINYDRTNTSEYYYMYADLHQLKLYTGSIGDALMIDYTTGQVWIGPDNNARVLRFGGRSLDNASGYVEHRDYLGGRKSYLGWISSPTWPNSRSCVLWNFENGWDPAINAYDNGFLISGGTVQVSWGYGGYSLYTSGPNYAANGYTWVNSSDGTLKKNIEHLFGNGKKHASALDLVKQLKPRSFDWKNDDPQKKAQMRIPHPDKEGEFIEPHGKTSTEHGHKQATTGFIAQEVETVIPDLVVGVEGSKGIDYARLTTYLVGAVHELTQRLEALEK